MGPRGRRPLVMPAATGGAPWRRPALAWRQSQARTSYGRGAMARVAIDPDRELAELKEYIGDSYDHVRLQRYEEAVDQELAQIGDESTLYRTSHMYLYNLTAFAMSRTKEPYLADLTDLVAAGSRVLDYGCGIGSDGLL